MYLREKGAEPASGPHAPISGAALAGDFKGDQPRPLVPKPRLKTENGGCDAAFRLIGLGACVSVAPQPPFSVLSRGFGTSGRRWSPLKSPASSAPEFGA